MLNRLTRTTLLVLLVAAGLATTVGCLVVPDREGRRRDDRQEARRDEHHEGHHEEHHEEHHDESR